MKKQKISITLIALTVLFVLAGCGRNVKQNETIGKATQVEQAHGSTVQDKAVTIQEYDYILEKYIATQKEIDEMKLKIEKYGETAEQLETKKEKYDEIAKVLTSKVNQNERLTLDISTLTEKLEDYDIVLEKRNALHEDLAYWKSYYMLLDDANDKLKKAYKELFEMYVAPFPR